MAAPLPENVLPLPIPRSASDQLVATWLPVVLGWCTRLGGPRVDPEDAAHDVLLTLLDRIGELRDPTAVRAFVFGITRRTLAAHRRRAWLRRWAGPWVREPAATLPGPEASLAARERAEAVAAALETISVDHRELIVLVEIEGRAIGEVAELLDLPVGTVKSRLFRARTAFRTAAQANGLAVVEDP